MDWKAIPVFIRYISRDGRRRKANFSKGNAMGIVEKLSYQLIKKNEYIADFNEEYQIGENPIGIKKKLMGAAYMLTHLAYPKYRSEIFETRKIKAYDFEIMRKKIDEADVVSFDIFDTLLMRPVYKPRDQFFFVEKENKVVDFRKKRIRAEEWARNHTNKQNREIDIFDIYKVLEEWCEISVEESAKKEIEVECKYCFPHPFTKKLYDYAISKKKIVIATSDMYIPKVYMKELLKQNGYESFDDIYVSCDYQKNKVSGELYEVLKEKYSGRKILHIGDNRYSDLFMAKKKEIQVLHINNVNRAGEKYRRFQNQSFSQSLYCGLVDSYLYSGLEDKIYSLHNPMFLYGFLCGGPMTLGLCHWINRLAKKKGCDKLLFLARDGYIVSEIYKKYINQIDFEYVKASRQALLPIICEVDYEMYLEEAYYKRITYLKMSAKEALCDVGLYSLLPEGIKETFDAAFARGINQWNRFKIFMLEHKQDILVSYQNSLQAFDLYISQVIGNSKKICVFDLGWRGASILYLKKYLEKNYSDIEVVGAMFGIQEMPMTDLWVLDGSIEAYGFSEMNPTLFSRIRNQKMMFLKERLVLEFMFSSTEKSLLSYKLDNGKIAFVYEEKSNSENASNVEWMHKGIVEYVAYYDEHIRKNSNSGEIESIIPLSANVPMWQLLRNKKVDRLLKQYHEHPTTLHGYGRE